MLKKGKILTVDQTSNLLSAYASQTLMLRFEGQVPAALADSLLVANQTEKKYIFALRSVKELESILSTCRANGLDVSDCSIQKPDLEEVFVHLMKKEELL